jgi:hypothetical protein
MLEAVQERLDQNPQAMRLRRETAEHPFGTLNSRSRAAMASSKDSTSIHWRMIAPVAG